MAQPEKSEPVSLEEEEQRIELLLAQLLRVGVLLAASLVLLGGAMYLAQAGGQHPDYARFTVESTALRSPRGIFSAAIGLQPLGLIQLGVMVLLATPVLRVAYSLLVFARERDWTYVKMTAMVLLILLLSLTGVLP